jgi:predicted O-methyltransferase YrrM
LQVWARVQQRRGHASAFSIQTHLTPFEKYLLWALSSRLRPGSVVVEIGSYLGASTCFLAMGAARRGNRVYCVDTWANYGMSEGHRDTYQTFMDNVRLYADHIVPLRGWSRDVAVDFPHRVDLLFLDGDHSYEGVRGDVEAWFPKLSRPAFVVLHDVAWAEGVRKGIRECVHPREARWGRMVGNIYWTNIGDPFRAAVS